PHVNPGPMKLQVEAEGYASLTRTVEATTSLDENRFVLTETSPPAGPSQVETPGRSPTKVHLAGTVIDSQTGRPLDRFSVLINERRGTHLRLIGEGRNGSFDWKCPAYYFSEYEIQIQADGYAPEVSAVAKVSEPEQHFEFKLIRGSEIAGQVLSPDGQPVSGA